MNKINKLVKQTFLILAMILMSLSVFATNTQTDTSIVVDTINATYLNINGYSGLSSNDINSTVQAYDADLDDLADGTLSKSKVEDSTNWDWAYEFLFANLKETGSPTFANVTTDTITTNTLTTTGSLTASSATVRGTATVGNLTVSDDATIQTINLDNNQRIWTTTKDVNVNVCPVGCNYTTIQAAVDDTPLFLNHIRNIFVEDGSYNEHIIVPLIFGSEKGEYLDTGKLVIKGNNDAPENVSIYSLRAQGGYGNIVLSVSGFNVISYNIYDDEVAGLEFYGIDQVSVFDMSYVGSNATYGIVSYNSQVRISEDINFGNGDLETALYTKHNGIIIQNDFGGGRLVGNTTESFAKGEGQIYLENTNYIQLNGNYIFDSEDGWLLSFDDNKVYGINKFNGGIDLENQSISNYPDIKKIQSHGKILSLNLNNNTLDASTFNNHGINNGAVYDSVNGGFTFDDPTDHIFVQDSYSLNHTSNLTVCVRFIQNSYADNQGLVTKGYDPRPFILRTKGIKEYQFYIQQSDATYKEVITTGDAMILNKETTVCALANGTDLSLYVNDIDNKWVGDSYDGTISSGDGDYLYIGKYTSSDCFNGTILNVDVWRRSLSEQEIGAYMAQSDEAIDSYVSQKDIQVDSSGNVNITSGSLTGTSATFSGTLTLAAITISANSLFTITANTTTMTCNTTNAGAIYYNGGTYKHYGCNSNRLECFVLTNSFIHLCILF